MFIGYKPKIKVFASAGRPPPSGTTGRPGSSVSSMGRDHGGGGGEAEDAERIAAMAADNIVLEVAAYPAGLFSPPETGDYEHQQRQLRGEGRRRVVLTAGSLWKRRQLMHPKVVLSESPPLRLSGWLERCNSDVNTLSGTEARDQTGNAESVVEEGAGNVGQGPGPVAEGSVGDGCEARDVSENGMGRKAQEKALQDLVHMVAFGPIGDGEDRRGGACMCVCISTRLEDMGPPPWV